MNNTLLPVAPSRVAHAVRFLAATVVLALCCTGVRAAAPPAQVASAWRIPGSFEPTGALWLGYDRGHAEWTAALVQTFAPHVKLKMLVSNEAAIDEARTTLFDLGAPVDGVEFQVDPQAVFFVQDAAVFAVARDGRLGVVDFRFNRYGLPTWCARRHALDADRAAECAAGALTSREGLGRGIAAFANAQVIDSPLFLEGGGVEVNGQGVIVANEALLASRNPGMSRAEMQSALLALPGIRKVVWLPSGLAEDPLLRSTIVDGYVGWGTGGHTDQFVRFSDARTILLAWVDEYDAARHPVARINRQRMQRNFDILSRATDAEGRPFRVVKVPMPRVNQRSVVLTAGADTGYSEQWTAEYFPPTERRREGDTVIQVAPSSYLNFVAANGVVVLPDYQRSGTSPSVQRRVRMLFERVFPGRRIQFVDSLVGNWYAGGPHCATLSQPSAPRR